MSSDRLLRVKQNEIKSQMTFESESNKLVWSSDIIKIGEWVFNANNILLIGFVLSFCRITATTLKNWHQLNLTKSNQGKKLYRVHGFS